MADEVIEAVVPEMKRDYTRKIYTLMRTRILELTVFVNALIRDSKIDKFTAGEASDCIWAAAMCRLTDAATATASAGGAAAAESGKTVTGAKRKRA